MQRRTVLQMVLGSVAACFTPLTSMVQRKVPPLRADVKYPPSFGTGLGALEVTGMPDQLIEFHAVYQDTLWPLEKPGSVAEAWRKHMLAPYYAKIHKMARETGSIQVTMRDLRIGSEVRDPWVKATAAAVLATRCVLSEEAATVMQLRGADIQRLPSCTENC